MYRDSRQGRARQVKPCQPNTTARSQKNNHAASDSPN